MDSKITLDGVCSHEIKLCLLLERKAITKLDSALKNRDIILPTKVHIVKAMVLPVVMYRCENWSIKKTECWRIDGFELWYWRRLLKSSLDNKEIKLVNLKGNQPWMHFGRTDAEAKVLILWPPDTKNLLIGKDPDAGKDWGQEKGRENEIVEWHYRLNGHESEQILGDSEGPGSLSCCSPWGCKESDKTEQLTNN